jgi:ubiquinone/menaquinone biosynthesis C-methylase UbiE
VTLVWVVVALVVLAAAARVHSLVRPTAFPPWLTPILEGPMRRLVSPRERTVERAGVTRGTRVLEVGPGGGYVTELLLERVGPEGRVVCLDLQPPMLHKVRARFGPRAPGLVCASGSVLPFRPGVFDVVLLVSVLGEIPDKEGAMREFARVLRPGGALAVSEAIPDPDYVRTHVLERLRRAAGFGAGERAGSWVHRTHRFVRR